MIAEVFKSLVNEVAKIVLNDLESGNLTDYGLETIVEAYNTYQEETGGQPLPTDDIAPLKECVNEYVWAALCYPDIYRDFYTAYVTYNVM